MKAYQIGCGQLTWPKSMDERSVLAEIAATGYDGAPAAPRPGFGAQDALALYAEFGLQPAPGYLGAEFWRADQAGDIVARAAALAEFAAGVGCREMMVAAQGFNTYTTRRGFTRNQVAGHVHPDDAMNEEEFRQFAETLNRVGEAALAHGVSACFHNHVGSVIETKAEIDRLWDYTDRSLVFMGPDTGHLAWAGVDVVQFFREYALSIRTLHIKDIDPQVLAEGREKQWDYATFSQNGIFTELGQGFVDFPAMFRILDGIGYRGWLTVETDVTRQPTARLSAEISRRYLASLGY